MHERRCYQGGDKLRPLPCCARWLSPANEFAAAWLKTAGPAVAAAIATNRVSKNTRLYLCNRLGDLFRMIQSLLNLGESFNSYSVGAGTLVVARIPVHIACIREVLLPYGRATTRVPTPRPPYSRPYRLLATLRTNSNDTFPGRGQTPPVPCHRMLAFLRTNSNDTR